MGNESKLSRRSFVANAAAFGTASLAAAGVFVNPALADEGGNQATSAGNPDFGDSAASKMAGATGAHGSTQLPET